MNKYDELIQKLFGVNLHGGMKLGLQNCQRLDAALGNPSKGFRSIHVAGTNGKGSVTKKIAVGLESSGKKIGLYTSPHISCFRERIRINGEMILEHDVKRILSKIFSVLETEKIPATFFEITTLLAFVYFSENSVDYAVIETGLGGRLDATNIIFPDLSIITSISYDHTEILGKSLEEIAIEKSGIIKPNTPVILGPRAYPQLLQEIANQNNCPCKMIEGTFSNFEGENNEIAKTALQYFNIPKNEIEIGLRSSLPCRMEKFSKNSKLVILDVAHNPDGFTQLFQALEKEHPGYRINIIFGLSKSKDIVNCLKILKEHGNTFYLVEGANGRGLPVQELYEAMQAQQFDANKVFRNGSVENSLKMALQINKNHELILICGTFFIMADAREALGINEPRDQIDMNERLTTKTQR